MKGKISVSIVLIVAILLVFAGAANAFSPTTADIFADAGRSAPDKGERFKQTLTEAGFSLQPGEFSFWDLIQVVCKGLIPDTLANNPWPNTYITLKLDQGTAGVSGIDRFFQLREDEAIVLVGQTPPAAAYFSYQTFMITKGGSTERLGVAVGDTINIGTIHTNGSDPYDQPIIYIITGNRETEQRVRAAALKAGYPASIINVETISPVIAPLGIGPEGSTFAFVHRVAVPIDKDAVENYAKNPPYEVFRVTPNEPLDPDPEPVPVLRVRGSGHTEMELYPALKKLRQAILDRYASIPGSYSKELDTKVWELVTRQDSRELIVEKPYVVLQRGIQILGGTRDTNYLATYPNFMLREGVDEFVIVYGVNHQKTGKATYSSVSIYADKDRWFGPKNGTMTSPSFGDSARQYLPNDPDPNIDMLYAIKVARNCNGEEHCLQVEQPDWLDINEKPYMENPTCILGDFMTGDDPHPWNINEHEMFFIFRSYMEPATLVGPDDNELLYDQAIYFGPYFAVP